ncbi:di-trans,poly-cis-decaprenylcistransferase [Candidatus Micrarchaeota archaeon]|nr:di-trans,poly-cis-decaprenylcistransferase [Candidatus Micrarchaeota archaeon]
MTLGHIAIIPDGNRRWAKIHNLPVLEGHKKGISKLKDTLKWADEAGVKILSLWILSTENLNRSPDEVNGLFSFFEKELMKHLDDDVKKYDVKVNFFGALHKLPKNLQDLIHKAEEKSKNNTAHVLNLFTAYGGREEIVHAVNNIIKDKVKSVTEDSFSKYLYTHSIPDPDLIIRTSGEMRTSGFMPWQSVYSELYFSQKLWPEFTRQDFFDAIKEYHNRKRRFGK